MSLFSRKPKNRFLVNVDITSLSSVPYINGHCYCKIRVLNGGGTYENRTNSNPIQNNIVRWEENFHFELKIAEISRVEEAKLRISVRRETPGSKSEVKIGYVDLQLSNYFTEKSFQGVLRGYEKTKQRQDNSILKVNIDFKQIYPTVAEVKNGEIQPGSDLVNRLVSSESKESQDVKEMNHRDSVSMGTPGYEYGRPVTRPGHSRNSSGASGYSSSNNSGPPSGFSVGHARTTSLDGKYISDKNKVIVDGLFDDLNFKKS